MPPSPTPPLEASLARIADALASLALAADATLELQYPNLARPLTEGTPAVRAWRDQHDAR